jgi:hypothetical protein
MALWPGSVTVEAGETARSVGIVSRVGAGRCLNHSADRGERSGVTKWRNAGRLTEERFLCW